MHKGRRVEGWGVGNRKQHYMYRAIVRCGRHDNKKQTNNSNNKTTTNKVKSEKMGDKRQYQCE